MGLRVREGHCVFTFNYLVDDESCKAEVGEFCLSVVVEQNVLTFKVSMGDVVTVQVLDGLDDVVEDGACLVLRQRASVQNILEQIAALCLLHDDARERTDTHNLLNAIQRKLEVSTALRPFAELYGCGLLFLLFKFSDFGRIIRPTFSLFAQNFSK